MATKYIIFLCLLSTVKCETIKLAEVHEEPIEETTSPDNVVRVARHPKLYQTQGPPNFDFKSLVQQDPQKLRYAQQQQIDSYVRAYQQQQNSRQVRKLRKQPKQIATTPPTTASSYLKQNQNGHQKSENPQIQSITEFHPVIVGIPDQYGQKKVVDPKIPQRSASVNRFPNGNNSPQQPLEAGKQTLTTVQPEKVTGYQVAESNDQDTQASGLRESRIYVGNNDIPIQQYPLPLSPNYLAQPTYVLANPQLNIDPKLLMEGLAYTLPENHELSYQGFQPASKSDIEALSSLLGKSPNAQLHGLNQLLGQQAYPIPIQQAQEHLSFTSQAQALIGTKNYTPIKEDVIDIANTQIKPNVRVEPAKVVKVEQPKVVQIEQQNIVRVEQPKSLPKPQNLIRQQHESKTVYGGKVDNLQYASQYAFGYKIRDFHSGNNFGHEEIREGDVAKGHYHVLLPDGRLQNVDYWADPSGYHAKVTYTAVGHH